VNDSDYSELRRKGTGMALRERRQKGVVITTNEV